MSNTILIGSCGYLGSELFNYLKLYDEEPVSIDLEWHGKFIEPKDHKQVYYRYMTKEYLERFDNVIVLAAHSSVKMVDAEYEVAVGNNLVNLINLIGKLNPEQKLIWVSSASVYGGLEGEYFTEDIKTYTPLSYYDLLKVEGDFHLSLSPLQYYSLRCGTIAGPSPNLRIDTVFNACYKSYKETGQINIFNPLAKRGILSTSDFCRAVHAIMIQGNYDKRGIYNLASFNTSIGKLGEKIAGLLNCPINYTSNTTKHYDFTLNTINMGLHFDYAPESTVESILESLESNWDSMNKGDRNKGIYSNG